MRRDNNPLQLLKLLGSVKTTSPGSVKTTFPEVLKGHGNNNKYNNNKIIYSVLSINRRYCND